MPERFWFLDTLVTVRIPHEEGVDGVSVLESRAPRGDSPPLHIHAEDEIFHLLEGELVLRVGDADHHLRAGQTLLVPGSIPHTYRVESQEMRCLVITTRGQFEGLVRTLGRTVDGLDLPIPAGPPTEQRMQVMRNAARRNGIDLVGPPLGV